MKLFSFYYYHLRFNKTKTFQVLNFTLENLSEYTVKTIKKSLFYSYKCIVFYYKYIIKQ